MPRLGPIDVSTQDGDPVIVGRVQLTPRVRVVQLHWLKRIASADQSGARGFMLVVATPVAVRVLEEQGERTAPIPDLAPRPLLAMLVGAALLPVLSLLVARFTVHRPRSTVRRFEETSWNSTACSIKSRNSWTAPAGAPSSVSPTKRAK